MAQDNTTQMIDAFQEVIISSWRAKRISRGAPPLVDNSESSKETVIALREIAEGRIDIGRAEQEIIKSYQSYAMPSSIQVLSSTQETAGGIGGTGAKRSIEDNELYGLFMDVLGGSGGADGAATLGTGANASGAGDSSLEDALGASAATSSGEFECMYADEEGELSEDVATLLFSQTHSAEDVREDD